MKALKLGVVSLLAVVHTQAWAIPQWSCKGEDCQEDRHDYLNKSSPSIEPIVSEVKKEEKVEPKKKHAIRKVSARRQIPRMSQVSYDPRLVFHESVQGAGNLPVAMLARNLDGYHLDGKPTLVAQNVVEKFDGMHAGDMIHALLEQAITASPSVPSPIRVEVLDGSAKGSILLGEAILESDLNRVLLQFHKLRDSSGAIYQVTASGLSPSGEVGLAGEYHSQDGKFFIAQFLTAGIAGFADATINRSQNVFGNYVEEPGLDTAAKKGVVSALSQTSQRMGERAKAAPGYTTTQGYQVIPILITEEPMRKRG